MFLMLHFDDENLIKCDLKNPPLPYSYKNSNFCYALFIFSEIEYHTMLKKLR